MKRYEKFATTKLHPRRMPSDGYVGAWPNADWWTRQAMLSLQTVHSPLVGCLEDNEVVAAYFVWRGGRQRSARSVPYVSDCQTLRTVIRVAVVQAAWYKRLASVLAASWVSEWATGRGLLCKCVMYLNMLIAHNDQLFRTSLKYNHLLPRDAL